MFFLMRVRYINSELHSRRFLLKGNSLLQKWRKLTLVSSEVILLILANV